MPGELDSTEEQLARFFGKPVAIASIASMEHPSPAPSLASSCPTGSLATDSYYSDIASDSTRTAHVTDQEIAEGTQEMLLDIRPL